MAYDEHRGGPRTGRIVYPVLSRRAGGLSLGINLFPDAKRCTFDCPYCEVFPTTGGRPFSLAGLEAELDACARDFDASWGPVRDICLSGDGEPTLSPDFGAALDLAADAKRRYPALFGPAKLVVITNCTGFLDGTVSALLAGRCDREGVEVWAKLDAGTEALFSAMSRSSYTLAEIAAGIETFAAFTPLVLQTMLCRLEGKSPTGAELDSWAGLVRGLVSRGARVTSIQFYTQARPSPHGMTAPLSDAELLAAAQACAAGIDLPFRVFGAGGTIGDFAGQGRLR
jgi:histidinol dehydrogenase